MNAPEILTDRSRFARMTRAYLTKMMKIADQRRQAIIQATQELFFAGVSNISMNMVADRAKVAKSSIFYFFKNKEELLIETIKFMSEKSTTLLKDVLQSNLNPSGKLIEVMRVFIKTHRPSPVLRNFMMKNIMKDKHTEFRTQKREEMFDIFHQIAVDGVECGEFRQIEPEILAELILRILDSIVIEQAVFSKKEVRNPEEVFKNILLLFKK